jgi:hypothetical protein
MHGVEHMRLIRALALVAGAFILLVQAASAQGVSPAAVLDNYERALGRRDIDGALSQLAEGAVITVHDPRTRILTSRAQVREFLQRASLDAPPVPTSDRQVDGATVTWGERTQGAGVATNELTVQAVVENGKIQSLVYRPGRLVQAHGNAAAGTTLESAGMSLGAVVLLGFGLLSLATARRQFHAGSNLRGRLVRELHQWRVRPRPLLNR